MADNLLPCPFCGGEAEFKKNDFGFYVICPECLCSTQTYSTDDDAISTWNNRPSPWHTGTPTEDGFYLCKVHYGDIPDDMRILEWVRDMGCFCLPESKIRGYHFYVGDEGVEVVYEWQRLTMRFRKEHGGWLEPYKED